MRNHQTVVFKGLVPYGCFIFLEYRCGNIGPALREHGFVNLIGLCQCKICDNRLNPPGQRLGLGIADDISGVTLLYQTFHSSHPGGGHSRQAKVTKSFDIA